MEFPIHWHNADMVNLFGNDELQGRFQSEAIEKAEQK
jgi:hypothetical protein